ncbi:MAG: phage terminase large subunit, partial [Gemmatimonadota bacterium]|nr:phage terminase large subunit [Gemmatimonadota bacterium]
YEAGFDPAAHGGHIVQSWDTASKDGALNDWSVCITALEYRGQVWIIDVFRARLTFPYLKDKVISLARQYRARTLLIEDAASGTQLLQTLWAEGPSGVPRPIARRPEADKHSRMAGVSGQIAGGQLLLPPDAPWLAAFKTELLGFPFARHDDQADALTQLMNWTLRFRDVSSIDDCPGPIVVIHHRDGGTEILGDEYGFFSDDTFDAGDDGW